MRQSSQLGILVSSPLAAKPATGRESSRRWQENKSQRRLAFIEGVIREMRRVVWPTLPDTARLTAMVLIVCVVFVVYLWAAGIVVDTLLRAAEGQRITLFG